MIRAHRRYAKHTAVHTADTQTYSRAISSSLAELNQPQKVPLCCHQCTVHDPPARQTQARVSPAHKGYNLIRLNIKHSSLLNAFAAGGNTQRANRRRMGIASAIEGCNIPARYFNTVPSPGGSAQDGKLPLWFK